MEIEKMVQWNFRSRFSALFSWDSAVSPACRQGLEHRAGHGFKIYHYKSVLPQYKRQGDPVVCVCVCVCDNAGTT